MDGRCVILFRSRECDTCISCAGAGFREGHAFALSLRWDVQFGTKRVFTVLVRDQALGFAIASLRGKLRFCHEPEIKRRFWREYVRVRLGIIKTIPDARMTYNHSD